MTERPVDKRAAVAHGQRPVRTIFLRNIGVNLVDGLIIKLEQPDLFGFYLVPDWKFYPIRCIGPEILVLV